MNPGKYEYPFRFVLPKNIPSTYNGSHGNIRYYLKANIDIPMAPDPEDERVFTVMAPIDFNDILGTIELVSWYIFYYSLFLFMIIKD